MLNFHTAAILALLTSFSVTPVIAADEEIVGSVETSGVFFKDSIDIIAFDDPDIQGITCYVTLPKRALSFSDPTDSSLACRRIGEVKGKMSAASDVFKASKNLFFKTSHVDRFFDAKRNVLIYISYTTSSGSDNHAHSVSVVPLGGER